MTVNDFRSFLHVLRQAGQLAEVKSQVDSAHQLAALIMTIEQRQGKATLCHDVDGSGIAAAGEVLGSANRVALALGCQIEEIPERLRQAIAHPLPPQCVVEHDLSEVLLGDEVDLARMPVPIHTPADGGRFLTAAIARSRHPATGIYNASFHRLMVQGRDRLVCQVNHWRHLRESLDWATSRGETLPIAFALGLDPAILIAAAMRYQGDEFEVAGALRGEPVPLVQCLTHDLWVPARAELVIEGYFLPGETAPEGPLGEFTGQFNTCMDSPVVQVTAIRHRPQPILHILCPASPEHLTLNVLPREVVLERFIRHVSPNIRDFHLSVYGAGFLALIALEKTNPGEPRNVCFAAMTSDVKIKWVVCVDPDVDIRSPAQIIWALSTRVDWGRDVFAIPEAQGHELDPASGPFGLHTKCGIDATLPIAEREIRRRVNYPDLDLNEFL